MVCSSQSALFFLPIFAAFYSAAKFRPPCLLLFLQPHHIYARAPHSTYDDHIFLPINPGVQGAKSAIMSGLGLDDIDDVCEDKSKNVDDSSEDGARNDEKAMAVV